MKIQRGERLSAFPFGGEEDFGERFKQEARGKVFQVEATLSQIHIYGDIGRFCWVDMCACGGGDDGKIVWSLNLEDGRSLNFIWWQPLNIFKQRNDITYLIH